MSMIKRVSLALLVLFALVVPAAAASLQSLFAPDAELWARWTESDENATASIEHEEWSAFLGKYRRIGADGIARISYGMVTPQDRETLDAYIDRLAGLNVGSYARGQQFSYWVNLYNALTVQTVLSAYPVESIRDIDISPGLFADGPWDAELISIEGEEVTLNDIEHRILRPIWNDPRMHYVLNCASIGCPNIGARAFGPDEMESILDEAARLYINSPRGVRIESGALVASRIYDWFHEDFGASEQEIIAHFRRYARPELAELLMMSDRIDSYEYDWALNDTQ